MKIGYVRAIGLLQVLGLAAWVAVFFFGNYPLVPHDLVYNFPASYELKRAWSEYGKLIFDFSPARCLGLPSFANPNGLLFSLFHFFSLGMNALVALAVTDMFILVFAYFGTLAFCIEIGLAPIAAHLLAVGWCLQGWDILHLLAGHVTYPQLALLPFIAYVMSAKRVHVAALASASFWVAHLAYSSGYYLGLVGIPSVYIGLAILAWVRGDRLEWRAILKRSMAILLPAVLVAIPKVLATMDFMSRYPRKIGMVEIAPWKALVYAASNFLFPLPYKIYRLAGWWYGDWESYQFLLPGLAYILIFFGWRKYRTLKAEDPATPRVFLRSTIVFLALLAVATVLCSGVLASTFAKLPVLSSLHVNPRWNALVLFPVFVIMAELVRRIPIPRTVMALLFAIFWLTPVLYRSPETSAQLDSRNYAIDFGTGRVTYCYEPIFGYGLESFPRPANQVSWRSDALLDPRCYLGSSDCQPGRVLVPWGDIRALEEYRLEPQPTFYLRMRPFALAGYVLLSVGMIVWLASAFRRLWRAT